jgi:HK97 family phage major capsid protein
MTAPVLPKTTAEWDHYLSGLDSPDKHATAVSDGTFSAALKSYVEAQNKERVDITAQVNEQVQATMTDFFKEYGKDAVNRLDLTPPAATGPNLAYSALENKRAIGAPLNGKFDDLADFLQTTWHLAPNNKATREKLEILNNYQEKVPSDGGFLVPEEFRAEILRLSLETAIVRPRARVVPMGSATLRFPAIDSTSNVSSVYGGVVAYWTEEGAELTESQATFGSVKLEAWKLTALAHVTNELVRDAAGAFGMFIQQIFPEAVSYFEDLAFIGGSGAGQPLGALHANNTAMLSVSGESGQTASTIVWENVIRMYARMLPTSINRAVWIASPDTFAELATMALSVGTGGSAVWLTDAHGAPQLTLLGRPVIMTEKAPAALGTKGDLSFVDFGMYLIGDRQAMTVDSSAHVKFTSDKTSYRVISRVDGRPWLTSAITPHNNSATLSPFVTLATR